MRTTTVSMKAFDVVRTSSGSGIHNSSLVTRCNECRSPPSNALVSSTMVKTPPTAMSAAPPPSNKSGMTKNALSTPSR